MQLPLLCNKSPQTQLHKPTSTFFPSQIQWVRIQKRESRKGFSLPHGDWGLGWEGSKGGGDHSAGAVIVRKLAGSQVWRLMLLTAGTEAEAICWNICPGVPHAASCLPHSRTLGFERSWTHTKRARQKLYHFL